MRRRDFSAFLGGTAVVWSIGARAQQPMPVIGYLAYGHPETDDFRVPSFRRGLNETGYVEGQNVAIEYRWARGQYEQLPDLAADLVRRKVSVIAAMAGAPPALAAKAATSTIPIVVMLADPVQFGLVAGLNRPGGNITGVAILATELVAKRLELLHELLPSANVIAALINPANTASTEVAIRNLKDAARALGLQLHFLRASTAAEIDTAFEGLAVSGADAL